MLAECLSTESTPCHPCRCVHTCNRVTGQRPHSVSRWWAPPSNKYYPAAKRQPQPCRVAPT
eukprot:1136680-Pelagomonas_calceolata.AAC.4